jgi:hypothetical protein
VADEGVSGAAGEPTRAQFVRETAPRRGVANPERMLVPTWEWLVRDGRSARQARQRFEGPDLGQPGWTFHRYGATATRLPDGRIVCIGGEHEDSYDWDFFIYNDVVVLSPAAGAPTDAPLDLATCGVEILGYPVDEFAPTDFQTATRVGDQIVIVGTTGYGPDRRDGETPVYVLDTRTWTMRAVPTTGRGPGWISRHAARLDGDGRSLRIAHGHVCSAKTCRPNEASFRLHLAADLAAGRWEEIAPCVLRRVAKLAPPPFDSWDPELADVMPRLGWPSLRVRHDVSFGEVHDVFAGDAVVQFSDLYGLRVDVDPATDAIDPGCAAVVARFLAVCAELGCPQTLEPWRDGAAD